MRGLNKQETKKIAMYEGVKDEAGSCNRQPNKEVSGTNNKEIRSQVVEAQRVKGLGHVLQIQPSKIPTPVLASRQEGKNPIGLSSGSYISDLFSGV